MGLTLTSDTSIHPAKPATRAEAIRLMLEVGGFDVSGANEVEFYDVEAGSEDAKYIQFAADLGFISGDPEGTFRPNDEINRAEIAKVIANFNDFFKALEEADDIDQEIEEDSDVEDSDDDSEEMSFLEKIMSSALNITSSLVHIKN
jgi:N-acetylmuramoyl-L-alanine amidase